MTDKYRGYPLTDLEEAFDKFSQLHFKFVTLRKKADPFNDFLPPILKSGLTVTQLAALPNQMLVEKLYPNAEPNYLPSLIDRVDLILNELENQYSTKRGFASLENALKNF